ncbi:MAG: DoxX family protein [Pyrinomonadaceae bacterium]
MKNKIIYWATSGLVAAAMILAAIGYFTSPEMRTTFEHLGFPDYFRVELGVAKILGAIVLIVPMFPERVKAFAYFGFAITFVSASIAHLSSGDPISVAIVPLVFLAILMVSFNFRNKLENV